MSVCEIKKADRRTACEVCYILYLANNRRIVHTIMCREVSSMRVALFEWVVRFRRVGTRCKWKICRVIENSLVKYNRERKYITIIIGEFKTDLWTSAVGKLSRCCVICERIAGCLPAFKQSFTDISPIVFFSSLSAAAASSQAAIILHAPTRVPSAISREKEGIVWEAEGAETDRIEGNNTWQIVRAGKWKTQNAIPQNADAAKNWTIFSSFRELLAGTWQ